MIMNKIFKLFKRMVLSCFILYSFNYISVSYNIVVPINYVSIFLVTFFGPFGICALVFFKYFVIM